jgi:hypothetical protein
VESRQSRAAQERLVAAEDQSHEILEDRLLDRIAVKFQRDPIQPAGGMFDMWTSTTGTVRLASASRMP